MPDVGPHPYAPGALEFVRAFVNTRDIEAGTDRLATPDDWRGWSAEHGISGAAAALELDKARELRELLRQALLANHDREAPSDTVLSALTEAAHRATQPVVTARGVELVAADSGVDAAIGRVVSAVVAALADGSWFRLKACAYDSCRWAFYDHSRSRTGRWCSMELCGNRAKQSRWREKQA
jgi:predicted RNA-binding Zn ribbon-like protein